MISRIIEWSMRNRLLVVCATLLLSAFGLRAMLTMPVDAIPQVLERPTTLRGRLPPNPCSTGMMSMG